MTLKDRIQILSKELAPSLIAQRRYLHQHPELSFEEYNTANFIENELKKIGISSERISKTGIVALIEGNNPTFKTIALRADIDALPILEENTHQFVSKNIGVMHACGHDVHTTCLLGAASILNVLKNEFEGTIKLIFQLGEEKLPGGASLMIKQGVLENPKVDKIFGQHVMPLIPVGKVGFRSGMYMASADEIYITIKGKGGHAALPELNIDPILIASHIIVALQQVVSRIMPAKYPSVLSFGKIIGNGATNVIPNEVKIEGTFRAMNEEWRSRAHQKIKSIAEGIAISMGAICEIDLKIGYPFLQNNLELTEKDIELAKEYLGEENVVNLDLWMGAEDFAYYTHHTDACFYRLGTQKPNESITPVHTSTFDVDDNALHIGAGLMAFLALKN